MQHLYRVLGLSPGASGAAIKAAYYKLAKRFHPDANAGEKAAQQIRDINRAYETLGDPVARTTYDLALVRQRAEARRRFWKGVATGAATFALTVGLFPFLMSWTQQASRPAPVSQPQIAQPAEAARDEGGTTNQPAQGPRDSGGPPLRMANAVTGHANDHGAGDHGAGDPGDMPDLLGESAEPRSLETRPRSQQVGLLSSESEALAYAAAMPNPKPRSDPPAGAPPRAEVASVASAGPAVGALGRAKPARWTLHRNAQFNFALTYPADVFTSESNAHEIDDRLLISRDGRALLRITSSANSAGSTISKHRAALLAGRYAGAALDYAPQRDSWFVLSGTLGEEMFYERVTFSCDGRSIHGWLLTYPVAERSFYDAIVEEMHRSYRYDLAGRPCGQPNSQPTRARRQGPAPDAKPLATADALPF